MRTILKPGGTYEAHPAPLPKFGKYYTPSRVDPACGTGAFLLAVGNPPSRLRDNEDTGERWEEVHGRVEMD